MSKNSFTRLYALSFNGFLVITLNNLLYNLLTIIIAFGDDGEDMVKLGCDIDDYENSFLNPLMNRIKKAEELAGDVTIVIDEQDMNRARKRPELDIFAYGRVDKSTIEKIKSKEKLSLSGFFTLNIDELGVMYLDSNGTIDLLNPFSSYSQSAKVCFGKQEICEDVNFGNSMSITWFWSKILIEREARIVIDQCEFKLTIKGTVYQMTVVRIKVLISESWRYL